MMNFDIIIKTVMVNEYQFLSIDHSIKSITFRLG